MMKNKDLQTLNMLRGEFEKSVDSAKVPLKLQKQSIVHMLEKDARERKAQEEAEANKKFQVVTIKKLMATAAALAVSVSGVLAMQSGGGMQLMNASSSESDSGINYFENYDQFFEISKDKDVTVAEPSTNPVVENPSNGQQPVVPEVTSPVVKPTENNPSNNQQTTAPAVTEPVQNNPPEDKAEEPEYIYQETVETEPEKEELITNSPEGVSRFEDSEADIVKSHNGYLYILTTGTNSDGEHTEIIRVAKIVPGNELKDVTEIPVSTSGNFGRLEECVEVYIQNDSLITVVNSRTFVLRNEIYTEESESVVAVYYDISDPANPQIIRRHTQDGEYVSSRLCDKKLYIVTSTDIPEITEDTKAENLIPGTAIDGNEAVKVTPENIFYDKKDENDSGVKNLTYVTVTDVSRLSDPVQFAFCNGGKDVSCHVDTIVFSRRYASIGETNEETGAAEDLTIIYRFNVKGDKISYANLFTQAKGVIVGGIYVDEKKGNLRVVTKSRSGYNVYVYNEQMECIDAVEEILSEVTVEKVKYIGDRLYLVYGENTGIIDFSKKLSAENIETVPTAISTNLYEVTSSVLLGIGFAGEEKKTVLTLFDFSDPENFRSTHTCELPEGYTFAAGNDGRCVMVDSDKKIFGIPVIRTDAKTNNDVSSYLIFSVEGGEITLIDECIHDDAVVGDAAVRCVCVDNTVYTVSGNRIVSHSTDSYEKISELDF